MSMPSSFWSALDAAVVVNLDHRADRWADMRAHLAPIAPMEKVHRLSAVRGVDLPGYGDPKWFGRTRRPTTWAGRAGCTLSHRNALRLMRERGWKRLLILEDDARFTPVNAAAGAALVGAWTRAGDAPAACFLGFTEPRPPVKRVLELDGAAGLFRIGGCLCTHAYVVNAAAADAVLARVPEDDRDIWPWLARHNAIDAWYARNLAQLCAVTAVSPAWVEQEESVSDITNRAGGTAQSRVDMAEAKGAPPWEGAGLWLKWKLRQVRGF